MDFSEQFVPPKITSSSTNLKTKMATSQGKFQQKGKKKESWKGETGSKLVKGVLYSRSWKYQNWLLATFHKFYAKIMFLKLTFQIFDMLGVFFIYLFFFLGF